MGDAVMTFGDKARAAAAASDQQKAAAAKQALMRKFAAKLKAMKIVEPVPTDTRLDLDGVILVASEYPGVPVTYINIEFVCPNCQKPFLSPRRITSIADIGRAIEVNARSPHCLPKKKAEASPAPAVTSAPEKKES